jgi:hypothetical protein
MLFSYLFLALSFIAHRAKNIFQPNELNRAEYQRYTIIILIFWHRAGGIIIVILEFFFPRIVSEARHALPCQKKIMF